MVDTLQNLLTFQSESLELLNFSINVNNKFRELQPQLQLPVMRVLKKIHWNLCGPTEDPIYPIVPIQPEQVPNLRVLIFGPEFLETGIFAESEFRSVQEVRLERGPISSMRILRSISALFPGLRRLRNLETDLNAHAMNVIAMRLRNIEDLELKISTYCPDFGVKNRPIVFSLLY